MNEIEIFPGVYTVNGFRTIYIKNLNAVVISDLQLGEEMYLAEERGIFIPQFQLNEMKRDLEQIYKRTKAKVLVINGDLKHEFGEASKQEWREVKDFISYAYNFFQKIILVRGNHDNYLIPIVKKLGLKVYNPFYLEEGFLFTHGHKKIDYPKKFHTLVIGHVEPTIALRRGVDKIKVPVILFGKMKNGKNIICLPAFSPLSSGIEINLVEKNELLSPILREDVDVDELIPIAVSKEVGALKFPKVGVLRSKFSF